MVKLHVGDYEKDGSPRRIIDYKIMQFLVKQMLPNVRSCVRLIVRHAKRNLFWTLRMVIILSPLKRGKVRRCVGSGQGLICSGDAYTHRFNNITSQFTNVVRCVNNSLLWEDDLKSSFDLICRYLSTCSKTV